MTPVGKLYLRPSRDGDLREVDKPGLHGDKALHLLGHGARVEVILLLLGQFQKELGVAIIFVTHDVGAAAEISDRIAVMYAGRFVETGTTWQVMKHPRHPYTQGLLSSTAHGGMRSKPLETIPGPPPSPAQLPPGRAFAPRCRCAETGGRVPLVATKDGAMARCVRAAALEHA